MKKFLLTPRYSLVTVLFCMYLASFLTRAIGPAHAQDNGSNLQQQLIDAAREVDRLQQQADAATQQAQNSMAAYASRTADAQAAINQANTAINAAYTRIAQVEAAQAQTAQALQAAQAAQQAVAQQQAAVATTLAGQSATLAIQASRDASSVIRDQIVALNLATEARVKAVNSETAYRSIIELISIANNANADLYEAKAAYAEMAIIAANNDKTAAITRSNEAEQSANRFQSFLLVSGLLNLALVVALIVIAIRFKPMIIERITHRDEPEPVVVENEVPQGAIILAPLDDESVFDSLKGQMA